ncbi:MAG: hypothetical protein H6732_14035 [Alphaproteobacteria bacterium]|nr:hypothetical protein [Alphaproteobacteria bacterium]
MLDPLASAAAQELQSSDPLLTTLHDESVAFDAMLGVLKAEVRAENVRLSDEAKLAWQRGARAWSDVRDDLQRGHWRDALQLARLARLSCQRGADEAFSVRASRPVKQAIKAYIDAMDPRLVAVRQRLGALQDPMLLERWRAAKGRYESAKQLAAVEQLGSAWTTLLSTAGSLDELVLDVARMEAAAPVTSRAGAGGGYPR